MILEAEGLNHIQNEVKVEHEQEDNGKEVSELIELPDTMQDFAYHDN